MMLYEDGTFSLKSVESVGSLIASDNIDDDEGNMLSVCYYSTEFPDNAEITINHYFELGQYLESPDLYEDEPYDILLKLPTPKRCV